MPFAVAVGISAVSLLYLAVNFSFFTVLTVPQIKSSTAVASVSINPAKGDW